MPMTSPVERISGPRTASTPWNRPNGRTASLTEMALPGGRAPPSPSLGSRPSSRSSLMDEPAMMRAAAFATGTPVALETNGTVREARGLASRTWSVSWARANCTFNRPRTPTPCAMARVDVRMRSMSDSPRVIGGRAHAESPEWMPASSMCSMTPARYMSWPSKSASTSISIASSRKRSTSTGCSRVTSVDRCR